MRVYYSILILFHLTLGLTYPEVVDILDTLPNSHTFFQDFLFTYSFKWNVTNTGTGNEELFGALTLTSTVPDYYELSWIAIGLGRTMRESQFIVCHNIEGEIVFHQHLAQQIYLAPTLDNPILTPLTPIGGYVNSTTHLCIFSRPTNPNDGFHKIIDVQNQYPIIWAFNPQNPLLNYYGAPFRMHAINHMGSTSAILNTGQMQDLAIRSNTIAKVHGLGLGFVWLTIFPVGVFVARYFKSVPWWIRFKVKNQSFGGVAAIVLILINLVYLPQIMYPTHQILGFCILGFLFVQASIGFTTYFGFSVPKIAKNLKIWKYVHKSVGISLMLCGWVQIALGINIIYPFIEPNDNSAWIAFIVVCAFWFAVFIITELYFQFLIVNESLFPALTKNRGSIKDPLLVAKSNSTKRSKSKKHKAKDSSNTSYTWESLAKATMEGKSLVVANGKYVIDIAKWINSHPGGQIILHTVVGTDITPDYYLEAGFDADNFVPRKLAPARKLERTPSQANMNKSFDGINIDEELKAASNFSKKEWKLIQLARKTHVHSKLAIQRLSQLTVGEMATESDERLFDPYEFRRYALTEIEVLKEDTEAVSIFRFCLLYPYDVRVNEPTIFLPGQYVEVLMKIGGEWVLRKYTPTSGNLTSIEIIIKKAAYGKMTDALFSAFPGESQYRIRGPFGTPFFNGIPMPSKEKDFEEAPAKINYGFDQVIFIAGGSGITPFIQLINQAFLPIDVPIEIGEKYTPQKPDELRVSPGDNVHVKYHYLDGWCFGMNLTTNKAGTFPVRCTKPRQLAKINLIAICESPNSYIGVDLVEGARIGFSDYLKVFQYNKNSVGDIPKTLIGQNFANQTKKVIVCGPKAMCSAISDILMSNQAAMGLNWKNVSILE
ncbi:NADH-cytochrome b5 reductase [Boothiomyces sp. JEL0866]|nr:NADH-cytochrome b5 reductase [Boothiomyces sp. JEL0866]